MKKIVSVILASILILSLIGCGQQNTPSTTTTTNEAAQKVDDSPAPKQTEEENKVEAPTQDITLTFMASQGWVYDPETETFSEPLPLPEQFEPEELTIQDILKLMYIQLGIETEG